MFSISRNVFLPLLVSCMFLLSDTSAYCNAMGPSGYGPRTSKAFPPGWNGLAKTPALGWRSWYAYYTNMDQSMISDVIDALTANNRTVKGWDGPVSLCDLGYCAAGIDEGWEGCGLGVNDTQHYLNGTPAVNPIKFPDMKGLVEYGHSKGVKMGWYFNGCGCIEKREPASGWDINYEGDIKDLYDFGFDSVKFDGCGRMCNMTFYAQLMQETGKAYEIENCHWGDCTPDDASSCPTTDWCPFNWYRTSGDSNNAMGTWYNNLQTTIRFQSWDKPVSQPGCWAYPDMLQVGRLGCPTQTHGCPMPSLINWTKAHFAAFCIVSSPLILSIHPSDENLNPILDVIGNKQALAINQAWAGHPGTLVRTLPPARPNGPVVPGTSIVTVPCDPTDVTELKWTYDSEKGSIVHTDLCLSSDGYDLSLSLYACGNKSTYQNFSWNEKTMEFNIMVPANHPGTLYPGCLNIQTTKVDVSKCKDAVSQQIKFDSVAGILSASDGNGGRSCLAGRAKQGPSPTGVAGVQIWAKPLGGGKTAALFINGGGLDYSANVSLKELNITASADQHTSYGSVSVSDVWTGEDAGPITGGVWQTGAVPSLDSRFVVFTQI
eukprot:m.271969 g.271969  ORF g.271969 m.271969 type:complete len:602 (+) comp98455_c0_seq1:225-2030(+)